MKNTYIYVIIITKLNYSTIYFYIIISIKIYVLFCKILTSYITFYDIISFAYNIIKLNCIRYKNKGKIFF